MARPAFIEQPGPAQAIRVSAQEGRGRAFSMALRAGQPLLEAVRDGFAREGFTCGVINFTALALAPFGYVMPALSRDGKNAAFYSDIFRPEGTTRVERGAMTFGTREGKPFFHCHALWQEANGKRSGGHMLPEETVLAEAAQVEAFGISGAGFDSRPDPEINFTVFGPVAHEEAPQQGVRAFAVRLHPHQCLHGALETLARTHGMLKARIYGGVGSTIGALFEGGCEVVPFATEVFICDGQIAPDALGMLVARMEAGLVDYTGGMSEGTLVRGANPVLMTFELIVAENEEKQ